MCGVCCVVCVVFILNPSPCIYRREPPASCSRNEPNRHWGSTTPRHVSSERRWGPWAATTWSGDHSGRPALGWPSLPRSFVRRLLGGPPCHVYGQGPVLSRFWCSGEPVDPCERVTFVGKVLPRIDDVSPCSWAAFSSHFQAKTTCT